MTTRPFVPPPRVPPPEAGGGKIAVEPPIAAPVPPPRSIWGIVLPIGLIVGVLGFIIAMYVSGQRSLATGFAIFPLIMLMSMGGMLFRGRGAAQKMPWSQLEQYRREYFARLDEVRDEVQEAARKQWEHREHSHWAPSELVSVAGSPRMWERRPGDPEFGVVRLGTGCVELAMTIDKPRIAAASKIEPATGHALRKFLLEQRHVRGMARVVWLERNPGISLVGEMDGVRGIARSMICQLAAFHSPSDLQIMIVTSAPARWDWVKWLPHCQHPDARDGCGERRLVFGSPADLEGFAGDDLLDRKEWAPPASGLHGGPDPSAPPLWVIIDDNCGAAEDWAGATGKRGVGRVCFVRLAPEAGFGVGFAPDTTYRLKGGVLRKRVGLTSLPEELDDAFYAVADTMSIAEAERFARTLAPWRPIGAATAVTADGPARDLLEVLGIRDARKLDVDRLWSARRTQNRLWMRFPIGLDPAGEVVELDLKETSQYGMGMHSVLIGFSGSGKSETIITEVTSLALTHSPETVNVAFLDWKMKSAGIVLERFPHVVASVSNLGDEMHLVERMLEALEGELDRRGALCAATNCKDLNVYNEKRMVDPSLEPVPGLVVIIDEYQELFGSELGSKFIDLCWRIVRQGRSMHVFLQLAGQTVDSHRLMKIRSLIGFFMALRTGTEEDSREAIGSSIAAHLPEKGKEGTGYLREGQRPPREFRAFYSSPPFVPPPEDGGPAPVAAAGTWFTPRSFTAIEVPDEDGLLAPPETNGQEPAPVQEQAPILLAPGELPPTMVDTIVDSLRATGARPPRQLWLPPLSRPAAADELVRLVRGKPWDVDYGKNPGLAFPVGIEDRPRQHRQDVHFLDLLSANGLVIGGPQSGVTNTLATMMTTAALMYRPERVQFYCVAAGGPSLAAVGGLPHVAGLAPAVDREGVGRIIASVLGIVAEREAVFAKTGLDMDEVRRRKFSDKPEPVPVAGGDVVLVIDGWATFAAEYPQLVDHIVALARSLSYGVHVVISHTSYLQGFKQALKPLATARIELRLTDPGDSEMDRQLAKKVPRGVPGRGLTKAGMHLLIGVPELGERPGSDVAGRAAPAGRIAARDIGALIAQVSGIQKAATVSRLPESVPFEEVQRLAQPITRRSLVPFGLSEADLGPAYLDIADHPHAIAVGAPRSGRSNFLRVLCRAITSVYRPEEAQILVLDPRRTLLGVVQGPHLRDYAYTQSAIREAIREVVAELDTRQPPPGTTQQEMMTKTFWSGPEIFVVIDDAGVWPTMDNPLMGLGPHIEAARDTGLHVLAATAVANWNQVAIGSSVLGKLRASLAPILILDGRRDAGKIVADIFAEPQRPGKATYFTRSGTTGALIGWSNPPTPPTSTDPQT